MFRTKQILAHRHVINLKKSDKWILHLFIICHRHLWKLHLRVNQTNFKYSIWNKRDLQWVLRSFHNLQRFWRVKILESDFPLKLVSAWAAVSQQSRELNLRSGILKRWSIEFRIPTYSLNLLDSWVVKNGSFR